jgi:hypothetical protein
MPLFHPFPASLSWISPLRLLAVMFVSAVLLTPLDTRAQAPGQEAPLQITSVFNDVELVAGHELSWGTESGYWYHLFSSPDLITWENRNVHEPGTGQSVAHGYSNEEERAFYRVVKTGFLTLPFPEQQIARIDGVVFAFNLNLFPANPTKIRLWQRPWNTGAAWTQIGRLTEFGVSQGQRYLAGSAVWLPPPPPSGSNLPFVEYEVKAESIQTTGTTDTVLAVETRHILVGDNSPPLIAISGGPPATSPIRREATFNFNISDPDGDEIRRIDFYDGTKLIGSTRGGQSPSTVAELDGRSVYFYQGNHSITAKSYDKRGGVGTTTIPYTFSITGGGAAPVLNITSPANGGTRYVVKGQSFNFGYQVTDANGNLRELTCVDIPKYAFSASKSISGASASGVFTYSTVGMDWTPGSYEFLLRAEDATGASGYTSTVKVVVLEASGANLANTLVNGLAADASVTTSNPTFQGMVSSSSLFSGGLSAGLAMDTGALLTTGFATYWNDGNQTVYAASKEHWSPGDAELLVRAAGVLSADAASIGFDVNCVNGQLELEYQFASEEYDKFISTFSDGLMILVDDVQVSLVPGIQPDQLPHGTAIVKASGINRGYVPLPEDVDQNTYPPVNPHLFIPNPYNPGNPAHYLEYGGTTIKLKVHAFVTPGLHRMRIVIADITDAQLDSAILLKSGSLRSIIPQP